MYKTNGYLNTLAICLCLLIIIPSCSEEPQSIERKFGEPNGSELRESESALFLEQLQSTAEDERQSLIETFLKENQNSPIIECNLACFYWYGNAERVLINGDLQNAWLVPDTMNSISCGENTFFYRFYSLVSDTRLDYTYQIHGTAITDPRNQTLVPSGFGYHSQLAMRGFNPDSIRVYNPFAEKGSLDTVFIQSTVEKIEPREIAVYTPPEFDQLFNLPVVFVIDGFKALEYCSYQNVLDNLLHLKKISPAVVVFVDYKESDGDLFINDPSTYINFISDELLPVIERDYKLNSSVNDRIICGISAGGQTAVLTALMRPDKFLHAAGQSTTLTENLLETIHALGKDKVKHYRYKLYLDVGRYDLLRGGFNDYPFLYANQLISRKLKELGIEHSFRIYNDGHEWANWRERTDDILTYFLNTKETGEL